MTARRRVALALLLAVLVSNFDAAKLQVRRWREPRGILSFVHEQFNVTPDPWQEETLLAFANPRQRRLSLQAAAGVGKSAVMAWCAWYFLATQCTRGEHPKGFATGVTAQNLRDNFWAECAKWRSHSTYLREGFTWTAQRIFANDHEATWFLAPRAWPKSGSADEQGRTLSGLHSKNVAVFVDESGGIPATVLRAAEQALSDNPTFGCIMQGGNPISLESMLYAAAGPLRKQWTIVKVTNDPDDPKRSPRGDIVWAREQIEAYGRDNPWVLSYILGQFPPASLNALLGIEDVETAMGRVLALDEYAWAQKRLGVDVARFGDDRSVIFPRQGLQAFKPAVLRTARTTDIAARVMVAVAKWAPGIILVDDTGHWGHGVIDNLFAANVPAIGVQFHAKALDPRYTNRRAEMWLKLAEAVKGGLALPNLPELVGELVTPTYTFVNGQFKLEDKEFIKQRLGRSPDLADALALTYALPDMPAAVLDVLHGPGAGTRVAIHHDPYAVAAEAHVSRGHAAIDHDPFGGDSRA